MNVAVVAEVDHVLRIIDIPRVPHRIAARGRRLPFYGEIFVVSAGIHHTTAHEYGCRRRETRRAVNGRTPTHKRSDHPRQPADLERGRGDGQRLRGLSWNLAERSSDGGVAVRVHPAGGAAEPVAAI